MPGQTKSVFLRRFSTTRWRKHCSALTSWRRSLRRSPTSRKRSLRGRRRSRAPLPDHPSRPLRRSGRASRPRARPTQPPERTPSTLASTSGPNMLRSTSTCSGLEGCPAARSATRQALRPLACLRRFRRSSRATSTCRRAWPAASTSWAAAWACQAHPRRQCTVIPAWSHPPSGSRLRLRRRPRHAHRGITLATTWRRLTTHPLWPCPGHWAPPLRRSAWGPTDQRALPQTPSAATTLQRAKVLDWDTWPLQRRGRSWLGSCASLRISGRSSRTRIPRTTASTTSVTRRRS
mmetsp:Transcript_28824/g.73055  ORF Transcript_28824/g.73055 Transcript_28824/m.73055 type:complete len:291 (-) Transcript_28824:1142-2014(-)